ncbi:DNA translocase FtsK [Pseudogracilibacillus sp. SO30301A]|uniref:DNA translocase FtsK n=1 Tax=Pseudogracilibacillus sp. SO30301A TaxID=3098291 RepID=UPI00300E58FB
MWKQWKKKVINFFFEEIVIEEEDEGIEKEPNKQIVNIRDVNTKIAYQYPKDQDTPFRFPVIPDENKLEKQSKNDKIRRGKTLSPYQKKNKEKETLIYGYKRNNFGNELEEVPAYLRRKKTNAEIANPRKKITETDQKENIVNPLAGSTRPEELDRIFRKRDRVLEEEIMKEQTTEVKSVSKEVAHYEQKSEQSNSTDIPEFSKKNDRKISEHNLIHHQNFEIIKDIRQGLHQQEDDDSYFEKDDDNKFKINEDLEIKHDIPNYLLNDRVEPDQDDSKWLQEQQSLLEQTLSHFNVNAKIVNITQGPSVTRFEIQPDLGVKVSRIRNLADDIKLNLAAKDIRIEAPIPGKNSVGIEVPNQFPHVVTLQEIIETEEFKREISPLTIALGLTIEGKPLISNIGKMPHGLIAGATGSGKSVCINAILLSLLYKAKIDEVKLLLIDPKMVELAPYNGIPHLIAPVITDPQAATMALKWAVNEMEERYEKFVETGVRNIEKYNERMREHKKEKMPYLVIVIDELADLMIVSPQEVEDAICRIAQKARACGIHLLLATQRPSVDVITGLIKANIPSRIAFSVSSQVDSRTIIDTNGAEKLLGKGDMLFIENGGVKRLRLQGPFVSDEEIDRVANYLRSIGKPNYLFEQEQLLIEVENEEEDELLNEVISFVVQQNQASTSLLQRRFRIGYNRAARLIDALQSKGIVSAQNGSKPREVLITKSQIEELI